MWSNFEQSSVEDETISNAFSSCGLFKIRSEENVEKYPTVLATVQNKRMVLAIDESLVLLEDEMVAQCSFLKFNAMIDAIAISSSSHLIVCCLRDGEIHGIFIKGLHVFTVAIQLDDIKLNGTNRTFISIQETNKRFYIVCATGSVYILNEINEAPLRPYLDMQLEEDEEMTMAENILGDIKLERLTTAWGVHNISTGVLIPQLAPDKSCPFFVSGERNSLHFRSTPDEVAKIIIPDSYEGVKCAFNLENMILILTHSGQLIEACPLTKLISLPAPQPEPSPLLIDEIMVMECTSEKIELLILTKLPSQGGSRLMQIVDYPSLKCHSEMDVPAHTWLVQQPKGSVNLYYLSGNQLNAANMPTEVEMLLATETDPADRFKKLIIKGHLEEAEEFGKQFELSLQPLFESKAKRLLLDLSCLDENNPELLEERFAELLLVMGKIENKSFFKNNRMIPMPSRKTLKRFLQEVLLHLDEERDSEDIQEVQEQLHRLDTLTLIDPYDCNMEWHKFIYHTNLLKMIFALFKSDIPTACLIWKRHSSSIMPRLINMESNSILKMLPVNTDAFNLVQWLRQFVPIVSTTLPHMMPIITDWSIKKTRALQYADHWPEIGLEFSTKVMEIFEELQFIHSDVRRQQERNVGKLRELVYALQALCVLKKSYNLSITLDSYLQDSIEETGVCILQRVHLDNLTSLVNDFLYPIFQEKSQSPVSALRRYIATLVANRNVLSIWLERAVVCIELLHNEDDRLESALLVLQHAPVPWPETVTPLVKLRYSTHRLAQEINTVYEIQVIKIIKTKYGWPADSSANIDLNLFMMRIVKLDLPDMLQDIQILTKAAPRITSGTNFNCCYSLVRRGKADVAYEFFKMLSGGGDSAKYASEIIEMFADMLECATVEPNNDKRFEELQVLIDFYKLITPHASCASSRKRLHAILHRFVLQRKFNLSVPSVEDLRRPEQRHRLLDLGIQSIMERASQAKAKRHITRFMANETRELCTTLDISHLHGVWRISQLMHCLPLSCALAYNVLEYTDSAVGPAGSTAYDDMIKLALELIVQQVELTKTNRTSVNGTLTDQSDRDDTLALLLAHELLSRAYLAERQQPLCLLQLLKYLTLVQSVYPSDSIESLYNGRETEIDENICRELDMAAAGEPTTDTSFEVKPNKDKRCSVSVFDQMDLEPVAAKQAPNKQTTNNRQFGSAEQVAVVKLVSRTFLLLMTDATTTTKNEFLLRMRNRLPENMRADVTGARKDFSRSIEYLIKAKMHNLWYTMAQFLLGHRQRANENNAHMTANFVSSQLSRVFRHVLDQKDVNFIDLFAMLMADQQGIAILQKLESEVRSDQQKVNLLTLAEMYNVHLQRLTEVDAIRVKRIKHFYYMEFCKQDPTIKGKFNPDVDNVEQLLKLFHNKKLDVELLERMSRDFGLDYQQLLVTQVIGILAAQELLFDIKTDSYGDEELIVLNNSETMRSLCQPYLNEIRNIDMLASELLKFLAQVHLYFYELYLCIIGILVFIDKAPREMHIWNGILYFLQHKMTTRRRYRPGQLETDMWLQSQTELSMLPKISRYRMPFMPIVEQPLKDILDNELSVDNCENWFPLIQMHTQLKGSVEIAKTLDYFCMSAVKNSIAEYKAHDDTEKWHFQPTNNAFLKSIQRLVRHVNNPSKAFMILYFVSNYAPEGADQVEASYECYQYALDNEKHIIEPKCQEQLVKIRRKYPTLKTQHLLYVYGLSDEKFVCLVEKPLELINKLYHHEMILKTCKLDINGVVKEIAQLHNLDLEDIQHQLLQKWLSLSMDMGDGTVLDETYCDDQLVMAADTTASGGEDLTNATENVLRANYILNSWPKKKALHFLIAHTFNSDGSVNTLKQLQMYECFSKMNDGDTSYTKMLNQRQFITIKCVHELKQLGHNISMEKFTSCNKIELLKTIWQRYEHTPQTLGILANICLGYDIYVAKIWNGILKRMTMLNMIRELNALVDVLSCQPNLQQTDGLVAAWQCVLLQPFKNANHTRSFAQEDVLHKALFRLQSCPVVHKLQLLEFAQHCMMLERPHMAGILLGLCRDDEVRLQVRQVIEKRAHKKSDLRKDILELEEAGMLPVILNLALKELHL